MKVLLIHNYYKFFGGEDEYVNKLSSLLRKNKIEVTVYAKYSNDVSDSLLSKFNTIANLFWNNKVSTELTKIIQTNRPDIVQIQNIYPLISPIVYRICNKYKIPIIQRISNYRYFCPKSTLYRDNAVCELCTRKIFSYYSILYSCYQNSRIASTFFSLAFLYHKALRSFNLIDYFIFPNKFTYDYYLENNRFISNLSEKSSVIPTFVSQFLLKQKKVYPKKYFLYVGRLSQEKGVLELLKLFMNLKSINLIVLGDGPLRSEVNLFKKYKNISIKNFAQKDEVNSYMKSAIATILPFRWFDVLPNVMIESFANGTPVIVPRFGTFTSLVSEKKTGLFFKFNDMTSLKDSILYCLEHPDEISKMKKLAIAEYLHKYSEEKHYQKLKTIYKELLEARKN